MSEPEIEKPMGSGLKKFFAVLLITVGGLIAGLCGLCTLVFATSDMGGRSGIGPMAPIALVIGGIPTAIGVGLIFLGRAMYRS